MACNWENGEQRCINKKIIIIIVFNQTDLGMCLILTYILFVQTHAFIDLIEFFMERKMHSVAGDATHPKEAV